MGLHPTQRRERILIMGPPGAGKSYCWLSVAEWLEKTKGDGRLYVADTDLAWEGQRPFDGHLNTRVVQENIDDWPGLVTFVEKATSDYQEGDWLVIDMIDKAWLYAQQHYYEEVFGKDLDVFFMEAKKQGTNPGGEWGSNWTVINKLHQKFMLMLQRYPGHVIACTPCTDVRQASATGQGASDSREVLHLFGKLGVKPQGQKDLAYNFHTVLLLQDVPRTGRIVSTAKDRSREEIEGEKMADFTRSYLMKYAGWTV